MLRLVITLIGLAGAAFGAYQLRAPLRHQASQPTVRRGGAGASQHRDAIARRSRVRPLDSRARVPLTAAIGRRVLGLYNSLDQQPDEAQTHQEYNRVHRQAELILNHLGLVVELRDVNAPLPDDAAMARYRGVIAWFRGGPLKAPLAYLRWLQQQIAAGRRVVLLEGVGAERDAKGRPTPHEAIASTYAALGLRLGKLSSDDPDRIHLVHKNSAVVEFERKLPLSLSSYTQQTLDGAGTSFLRLALRGVESSQSDLVVVTPAGGYVAPDYAVTEGRLGRHFAMQWRINPFVFFAKALGIEDSPRPDFTTLNGSRIFYSHIDGDGLPSISEIDRKTMCGEMVRREVLEPFDLPVTASFVVAGIEPPPGGNGSSERLAVARAIAALPNIELGSHGFAHPMNWRARKEAIVSYDVDGYHMNAEKEIAYSVDYIDREIAPRGKRTEVMLWTGWCNPAPDQLAIADRIGVYNLNGGDPRMDAQFPSYLHLVPPVHRVGDRTQYFTSGPNDFILTDEWTPPYHRWANLIDTLKNTDAPRRVYPMNVYYHFYIAQKPGALAAMKKILNWVVSQQPAGLWVTEYIDIVRDFVAMQIAKGVDGRWVVRNSGFARTIRFDDPTLFVDMQHSEGVLGYRRLQRQSALYVHLDQSTDHVIALRKSYDGRPHLIRATGYVDKLSLSATSATLMLRAHGRKQLTFGAMLPNASFVVTAQPPEGPIHRSRVFTDAGGTLNWSATLPHRRLRIRIGHDQGRRR
ncbi:MAG: hypothetical protein H6707_10825 [Deltaproteobacteria bacterium]|nr:hypothetical protein [Deltaproteobacteria bacterium]